VCWRSRFRAASAEARRRLVALLVLVLVLVGLGEEEGGEEVVEGDVGTMGPGRQATNQG
jgi:hypothetical protein